MANRFPLIFNSGAGQIQELAASDNLDLTSSNLVNAGILFTSSGSATAPSLQIGSGTTYNPGLYSPGTDQLAISTNGTSRIVVDASGNVNIDSNTLYVDATNNRVGLGSSSPSAKLHVQDSGSVYIKLERTSFGTLLLGAESASNSICSRDSGSGDRAFEIYTGTTSRLYISAAGLVGLALLGLSQFFILLEPALN